jgi:hypothetical protein
MPDPVLHHLADYIGREGVSMAKLIAGTIVVGCVMAAGLISSGALTGESASQAVTTVESDSDPVPVSCNTLDLEKKCCPKYCKAPSLDKDKVFDKCAKGLGCDEYVGHGFSNCNSSCK